MKGADTSRYCEACGHTIHNLSALTPEQRAAILKRAKTETICGSYFVRLSGELVTPESALSLREVRGIRQVGIAALSASALALAAGCVSHPPEKKTEPSPQAPEHRGAAAKPEEKEEIIQLVGFIITEDEAKEAAKPEQKK